ncbi:hypothetical protein ACW0KB_20015 [Virgibacillus salarius]
MFTTKCANMELAVGILGVLLDLLNISCKIEIDIRQIILVVGKSGEGIE